MKKCNNCQVSYNGNIKSCPFCNNILIGPSTKEKFPNLHKNNINKKKTKFIISLFNNFIMNTEKEKYYERI